MFGLLRVPEFETRYNIAPTQQSLFVHVDDASQRMGQLGRWGLVPPWVKDVKQMGAPLINARAETVREKRSFQQAFKHRRCLVPASGFYEWLRQGKDKQPYHIHRQDDAPFLMAGLWEPGKPADGGPVVALFVVSM